MAPEFDICFCYKDKPNIMKVAFFGYSFFFGNSFVHAQNKTSYQQIQYPVRDTTVVELKRDMEDNLPVINLEDADLDEGTSLISSILTAGRDPFLSQAEYNFSV